MGGSSGGNSTSTVNLPKWQEPYVKYGAGQAQDLYRNGGTGLAGFTADTVAGQDQVRGLAGNNQLGGAASGLATNTLNGGFLNSNPYIDKTFEQARLATQNGLSSEFAHSGRNIGASEGLRSQQLDDLATKIYGGNYAQERQNQMATLGMSPQLNQSQYTDANAMLGIGAQQQQQNQAALDQPGQNLDQYMQRVSGSYGQVNSQPTSQNRVGGALGGGMLGSQLGSGFGGYGGMIGGGLGALAGYFG